MSDHIKKISSIIREMSGNTNIELSDSGKFSMKNKDKYVNASLGFDGDSYLLFVNDHNYSEAYVKKAVKNQFDKLGISNYIINLSLHSGDIIWIYPNGNTGVMHLPAGTWYYRLNNGPLRCNEGLGTLGRDYNATFIDAKKDICDGGSTLTNYYVVKLN
ncbi:hypothetical protein K6T82_18075 [Flavobacterium sp. 17A]|uniref:Uncharacterized protein n=1 Tax=Flavobacterium potami TaxID=2872310 RepID=A0A9X1KR82_9FLAO|nr:hypothetical protein [Flavobacterium potami]MBZ4036683.1 hypothetical protein [Flavobacterium potami]